MFLKEFFENIDFEKNNQQTTKNMQNNPVGKELTLVILDVICTTPRLEKTENFKFHQNLTMFRDHLTYFLENIYTAHRAQ